MIFYKTWIPLIFGLMAILDECKAAGPPKWVPHDSYGKSGNDYASKFYSTEENPNAKYNPSLPEELRAQFKGKKWSAQVKTEVCTKNPDSGYFCPGAVGDLPPLQVRYYFSTITQSCHCMLYNGCDGNQNNFRSDEHCREWCSPNLTLFERRTLGKSSYGFTKNAAKCLYFY